MSELALGDARTATLVRPVARDTTARRVLHVNDCAFTAHNLLREAQDRGLPWSFMPLAASGRTWDGPAARAQRAVLGAAWLAKLSARASRVDLLHVHFATVYQHTRFVPRRFALHCHGTDVRTLQYEPRYQPIIHTALSKAQAVFYSTPDLAEHVLPHRGDAVYLPVPIDTARLPAWQPARPLVLFASRWDDSKGLDRQLAIAERLVTAVGPDAQVAGLDWGSAAPAAGQAGVELLPRRSHDEYLQLLAGASVVVGQSSGILAASELEALAIGVPVVMRADLSLYAAAAPTAGGTSANSSTPPVLERATTSPDDVVQAVQAALADPQAAAQQQGGPAWVHRHHGLAGAVNRVLAAYEGVS